MHIAIVGSGISGLVCARMLSREHDVTVFEADSRVGGHSNTVDVRLGNEVHPVDTGFIVYNERTYPNFTRMLRDLDVSTEPTSMSFSVRCDGTGLEYNGSSLNGLFAQRRNLIQPGFYRMLADIARFNREGPRDFYHVAPDTTVAEYLAEGNYSENFARHYLLPMGAAIWSCPFDDFSRFPIKFILEFYINHGLLSLRDRPVWRTVKGGSRSYVDRLITPFRNNIRLDCPVSQVRRFSDHVSVRHSLGEDRFDEVVFACHSDQALRILADADDAESEVLSAFPYSQNTAVLHTDESLLPKRRRAWASWNYHIRDESSVRPTLTYNMNILQRIKSEQTICVTLNEDDLIAPEKILKRFRYSHPIFTSRRSEYQARHGQFIRRRRTSFCGAYWRNGFHEDGVVSGLAVCERYGMTNGTSFEENNPPIACVSGMTSRHEEQFQ